MHLWLARQKSRRRGVLLQIPGAWSILVPLVHMGKNQLEEVIDGELEKSGVPKEQRAKIREQAEIDYEERIKVSLASQEIRRRLEGSSPQMSKRNGRWTFTRP
jgi:hypothetical protein